MSFESLVHSPDFELPANYPNPPGEILSLIEEFHRGLHKVLVHKMIRRGKYSQIAQIICQENPSKSTSPTASAEDIAEYAMACIQWEIDKSDDPGNYKVSIYGPPGKGRIERSKHIDMSGEGGEAQTKQMLSEGDLIEQQTQYISELHQQNVTLTNTVSDVVKTLVNEWKDQTKVISEAAQKLADVESMRLAHELEMRVHNDNLRAEEAKEEAKNERFKEMMRVVEESGAVEGIMKAVYKKMAQSKNDGDDKDGSEEETESESNESESEEKPKKKGKRTITRKKKDSQKGKKGSDAKKKRPKRPKPTITKETLKAVKNDEELDKEQMEEIFKASAVDKMDKNPMTFSANMLSMMIEEKDQWGQIREILTEEQFNLFKKIGECENDKKIKPLLKKLYNTRGLIKNMLKLSEMMDEDQEQYAEQLVEYAASLA